MATVTVTVSLRRIEGRQPVKPNDLAQAVAGLLTDLEGSEVEVIDTRHEDAVYEVTAVHVHQVDEPESPRPCRHCGEPVPQTAGKRARDYCSNACRQAAYRER